jgi:hypothetical protein
MNSEIPKAVLARYPQIQQIEEAIRRYKAGGHGPDIHCTICNGSIDVLELDEIGVMQVSCPNKCTYFRSRWDPNIAQKSK